MILTIFISLLATISSSLATIPLELGNIGIGGDPVSLPSLGPLNGTGVAGPSGDSTGILNTLGGVLEGKFPCIGTSSLKAGTCLPLDACGAQGGFIDGKGLCLKGQCCVQPVKCGEFSLLNETVLANEGFPQGTDKAGDCQVKIVKPFGVAAIKLIVKDLELAPPDEKTGQCLEDAFWVEGTESELGKICGMNRETHLYYPTSIELKDVFIHFSLSSSAKIARRWMIRADFIKKDDPQLPPPECTQYYTEQTGLLTSLNFDLDRKVGLGNIDGLTYRICIKKIKGTCKLELDGIFFELGEFSSHGQSNLLTYPKRYIRAAGNNPDEGSRRIPAGGVRPSPVYHPGRPGPAPTARPNSNSPAHYAAPHVSLPSLHHLPYPYPHDPMMGRYPGHYQAPPMHYMPFSPYMHPLMAPMMYPHPMLHPLYQSPYANPRPMNLVDFLKMDKMKGDFLGKFDKFDDKLLSKLESLGIKLDDEALGLSGKPVVCPFQDFLLLPIPDDGTSAIHCGKELHFGNTLISSFSPYQVGVFNKGKIHGKGFAINYKQLSC
ncbi:uncharacterized protein LOC141852781 [Brevipalpus obovatus]|uniref:uncharacterized protein LOC141852781 n=1 Tax=Brevipalpus obovatus TaxID=246614 RepID=UPI003D9DD3DB